MANRVFRTMVCVVTFAILTSVGLVVCVLLWYFRVQLTYELHSKAQYVAYALGSQGLAYLDTIPSSSERITLVANDGTVLADTAMDVSTLGNHANRTEVRQALQTGSGTSVRRSDTLMRTVVYYAILLEDGNVLRVSTTRYSVVSLLLGVVPWVVLVVSLVVGVSSVVSKGVARSIVKPIEAIDLDSLDCECVYPELAPILSRLSVQRKHDTFERARRELLHREYVANVSHELKTPLTSISGFAEIMKSGETDANTVVDFSNAIYDEAQRLITLVNDIIKVSELDGGATHLTMEPVDLLGIVHSTVRRLKPQADRDAITVRVVGGETLVLGVPKVLDEMLYNLCDNAIKYNHPHGSVVVTLTSGGGVATVTVEDTGIGIPKVHQERVFERFYRVDKSHSKAIGGTGLGLSIVKHGAIYHDAKLSLVSREGVGTVVTLEFRALGVPLH